MARSFLRGHPIVIEDGRWIYKDTRQHTTGNPRPCGHCGKEGTLQGHDGCLGTLQGVMNACCGHGIEDEAYVQFSPGNEVYGKKAVDMIKKIRRRNP